MARIKREIQIPFSGFYESMWSKLVDDYEDQHGSHYAESDENTALPAEIRLTADDYNNALQNAIDYQLAYTNIAKSYGEAFNRKASEILGFDLGLKWSLMTSPREYNFATDRIFMLIPFRAVKAMFAMSKKDKHAKLAQVIKDNCTSYDGFASFYSNDLSTWLAKPVKDWDHNELKLLLKACLALSLDYDAEEFKWDIYEYVSQDGAYSEIEPAVNWDEFNAEILALVESNRAEYRELNPDWIEPPPRCKVTKDMFTGKEG